MKYVVDTNVVSEAMKASSNDQVLEWLNANSEDLLLTTITIEELRFGQHMMPKGKKQAALRELIDALVASYENKLLTFDAPAAEACALFHQQAILAGHTPTIEDMMIAGITHANKCILATRNTRDFDFLDIPLVNPYEQITR